MSATAILFSIHQAAERLGGVSPWTLRKHIAQGHIRITKIGRRILLGADELERIHRDGLPSLRSQVGIDSISGEENKTDAR